MKVLPRGKYEGGFYSRSTTMKQQLASSDIAGLIEQATDIARQIAPQLSPSLHGALACYYIIDIINFSKDYEASSTVDLR